MSFLIDVAGWISAALILLAYVLVSTGRLTGQSRTFQVMNVAGAAGFVVYTAWHHTWPTMALNIIWCVIGVGTLIKISRQSN